MGDPKKLKNKTSKPKKLLDKNRLLEEGKLKRVYGLKCMRELWLTTQELKKIRHEARKLLSLTESERKNEEIILLSKLNRLGILDEKSKIEDVLSLEVKDILERRLQTMVLRKGLAKTIVQARQFITHGFIAIGHRMINVPSYIVTRAEEPKIRYYKKIEINSEPVKLETKEKPKTEEQESAEIKLETKEEDKPAQKQEEKAVHSSEIKQTPAIE